MSLSEIVCKMRIIKEDLKSISNSLKYCLNENEKKIKKQKNKQEKTHG